MVHPRIVERPGFEVAGRATWISGQDNSLFGRFWEQCRADGTLSLLDQMRGPQPGAQTAGFVLGISRVENDPANRAFHYLIAAEKPAGAATPAGLETYEVPAARWAVFGCHGPMPDALVQAEMLAFMEWLPTSGFAHARAPEMEVYPASSNGEPYCEFWLPVRND